MITPREIYDELRGPVMGQDEVLRELSVALVKHLVGHPAGNILLIGSSGSGKTTMMKAIESYLSSRADLAQHANVIRINANVLAEDRERAGWTVLERLYRNALRMPGEKSPEAIAGRMERAVVFVDEVDKIRAAVGGTSNVKGIVGQEALLTLMENEDLAFELDEGTSVRMNSSSMLFVAGGAFEELYDDVLRRALIGVEGEPIRPRVVVSQTGEVREELGFHLRDYLRYDDLFRYGMTPQFISRFESIVVLNDLGEQDLARIFVEPDRSIFRVSREYFRRFGIDLQITKGAIRAIAWEASRQKRLGARALKEVYRRVIRALEFDPREGHPASTEDHVVVVDEAMVRKSIRAAQQGGTQS